MLLDIDFGGPAHWSAAQFNGELCRRADQAQMKEVSPGHLHISLPVFGRSLLWATDPIEAIDTCRILIPFYVAEPFAMPKVTQTLHASLEKWGRTEASIGVYTTVIDEDLLPSMVFWYEEAPGGVLDDAMSEEHGRCLEGRQSEPWNALWHALKIRVEMRTRRFNSIYRLIFPSQDKVYKVVISRKKCTPSMPFVKSHS